MDFLIPSCLLDVLFTALQHEPALADLNMNSIFRSRETTTTRCAPKEHDDIQEIPLANGTIVKANVHTYFASFTPDSPQKSRESPSASEFYAFLRSDSCLLMGEIGL
jgi:hypothetical protein